MPHNKLIDPPESSNGKDTIAEFISQTDVGVAQKTQNVLEGNTNVVQEGFINNYRIQSALYFRGELAVLTEGLRHAIIAALQSSNSKDSAKLAADFLIFSEGLNSDKYKMLNPQKLYIEKTPFEDPPLDPSIEYNIGEKLALIQIAHQYTAKVDSLLTRAKRGIRHEICSEKTITLFEYLSVIFSSYRAVSARTFFPQMETKNDDPIVDYMELGRELANQTYVVDGNVRNSGAQEVPPMYWAALRNSAFAAAVVMSVQNAFEASARIAALAPEEAHLETRCTVTPIDNQNIEVRFDILHPSWTEGNHAGRAIEDFIERLSQPGQIKLKFQSGEYEPYRSETTIIAQIKIPE